MDIALASRFDQELHAIGDKLSVIDGHQVRCGFEVEFASSITHEDFADELQHALGLNRSSIVINKVYGAAHNGDYRYWSVETDGSIVPDNAHRTAKIELVSPILPLDHMISALEKVFKLIDTERNGTTIGVTNWSTGCHLTFSLADIEMRSVNPIKLYLLLGERYWASLFDREDADYAQSVKPAVEAVLRKHLDDPNAVRNLNDITFFPEDANGETYTQGQKDQRTNSINIKKLFHENTDKRCVELRLPGGPHYTHKFTAMARLARRFAFALYASTGVEFHDVYQTKLARALSKMREDRDALGGIKFLPAPNGFSAVYTAPSIKGKQALITYKFSGDDVTSIELDPNFARHPSGIPQDVMDRFRETLRSGVITVGAKTYRFDDFGLLDSLSDASAAELSGQLDSLVVLAVSPFLNESSSDRRLAEAFVSSLGKSWSHIAIVSNVLWAKLKHTGQMEALREESEYLAIGAFVQEALELSPNDERVRSAVINAETTEHMRNCILAGLVFSPVDVDTANTTYFRLLHHALYQGYGDDGVPLDVLAHCIVAPLWDNSIRGTCSGIIDTAARATAIDTDGLISAISSSLMRNADKLHSSISDTDSIYTNLGLVLENVRKNTLGFDTVVDLLATVFAAHTEPGSVSYATFMASDSYGVLRLISTKYLPYFGIAVPDFSSLVEGISPRNILDRLRILPTQPADKIEEFFQSQDVVNIIKTPSFARDEAIPHHVSSIIINTIPGSKTAAHLLSIPVIAATTIGVVGSNDSKHWMVSRLSSEGIEAILDGFIASPKTCADAFGLAYTDRSFIKYVGLYLNFASSCLDVFATGIQATPADKAAILLGPKSIVLLKKLIAEDLISAPVSEDIVGMESLFASRQSSRVQHLRACAPKSYFMDVLVAWFDSSTQQKEGDRRGFHVFKGTLSGFGLSYNTIPAVSLTPTTYQPARYIHHMAMVEPQADDPATLSTARLLDFIKGGVCDSVNVTNDNDAIARHRIQANQFWKAWNVATPQQVTEVIDTVRSLADGPDRDLYERAIDALASDEWDDYKVTNPAVLDYWLKDPASVPGAVELAFGPMVSEYGIPETYFGRPYEDFLWLLMAPTTPFPAHIIPHYSVTAESFVKAVCIYASKFSPDFAFSARTALFYKRLASAGLEGTNRVNAMQIFNTAITQMSMSRVQLVVDRNYPFLNALAKYSGVSPNKLRGQQARLAAEN